MPRRKKEDIQPVIIVSPTQNANKMPYDDFFKQENGKLFAKQDISLGGISYKKNDEIEETQWDKYNLMDSSLYPIVIRKKKELEIIGFSE